MIDGAHAQVEILDENDEILVLASFYWDYDMCWTDFTARVVSVADRMYAEFDDGNTTQYIQFKTGGDMCAIDQ
jgi:hypothetical protein